MGKKEKLLKSSPTRKAIRLAGLLTVQKKYGRLMAEDVFNEAKLKSHPLHSDFEWDRKEGWRQYNLEIARTLISMYRLEIVNVKTGKTIVAPMFLNFHNLPGQKGPQKYHQISVVLKSKNHMAAAMATGIQEMSAIVSRWTWHDVLGPVCQKFLGELKHMSNHCAKSSPKKHPK